jgi:hypothetical protein
VETDPTVGASLLAKAVDQLASTLAVEMHSSDRRLEQARSHRGSVKFSGFCFIESPDRASTPDLQSLE